MTHNLEEKMAYKFRVTVALINIALGSVCTIACSTEKNENDESEVAGAPEERCKWYSGDRNNSTLCNSEASTSQGPGSSHHSPSSYANAFNGNGRHVHLSPEAQRNIHQIINDPEGSSPVPKGKRSEWGNAGQRLPSYTPNGTMITYTEWDIESHPHGQRGANRLITGSDRSAYFTGNHYRGFEAIRPGPGYDRNKQDFTFQPYDPNESCKSRGDFVGYRECGGGRDGGGGSGPSMGLPAGW
jgi:guanyl-specific ribonuclease Sa